MQKRYRWKLKNREIVLGERTLIMGVLNVTPDSFSDGGDFSDPDRAFARALEIEEEGADILDIGAESTRPNSARISEAEELRRLIPVVKRLKDKLSIPISVDTYKSAVAEKALEHGAEIINDPTGALLDLQLPRVVTKYDAGLIVNHMRGTPETWGKLGPVKNLMRTIDIDLDAALGRCRQARVQQHQLVIDPGIGFGKRREQNSEIIACLGMLERFNLPILVGPSRKSFLKQETPELTDYATAAAVAASILNGAHIVRVHNVKAMKACVDVVDAIRDSVPEEPEPEANPKLRESRGPKFEGREGERQQRRHGPVRPPSKPFNRTPR